MMLSDFKNKFRMPNNRFLFVMSIIDIIHSLAFIASSSPVPRDTGYYRAVGNHISCSIQGFVFQLGLAVPCYNLCLCIWFLMHIKYNMHPKTFARKIEPYCHATAILVPLTTAILCAALDKFDSRGNMCWIGSNNSSLLFIILCGGSILIICFTGIIYCLSAIYLSFLYKERKMRRYSTSSSGMLWRPNTFLNAKKLAANQGFLFSFAFFITFIFPTLNVLIFRAHKSSVDTNPLLDIPQSALLPLQGMWNFLIYSKRKIRLIREDYPELSFGTILRKMIFRPGEVRPRNPRGRGGRGRRSSFGYDMRASFVNANGITSAGVYPVGPDLRTNTSDNDNGNNGNANSNNNIVSTREVLSENGSGPGPILLDAIDNQEVDWDYDEENILSGYGGGGLVDKAVLCPSALAREESSFGHERISISSFNDSGMETEMEKLPTTTTSNIPMSH
eukprot:CAMPEP_0203666082 /NCGR_PEP_ID=MMETSP0090-20130426/3189_1 /ASSEMBLY_ACC=CAM_ASM_001088 /TAXON_ID=426623 /ORGANISM="Chaetoceros affinis, Strain CCMP159" /LENGTH=446 /DNA_ID=CAMNT_0050529865 /DNA_START=197 /DNA_END=1537 /DNA_ORIENTATION=-